MSALSSHPLLQGLNEMQRQAVLATEGPVAILAGAGSGKTRVITHRIAWIVDQGAAPSSILALTFTNKAAREMARRVESMVGQFGAYVSTFHSFCALFLREEFPAIGRSGDFSIYDRSDALSLLKRVYKELNIDPKAHRPESALQQINRWKNLMVTVPELRDEPTGAVETFHVDLYEAYDKQLKLLNACDFDDLLCQARTLLLTEDAVRERWQRRIRYVLIDEYQDTNQAQYQVARLISEGSGNICVTGDQDQSIYSWRGANPESFESFLEDHPDSQIIRLEQNYRSTGHILKAASSLIAHNQYRIPKTLWTENPPGEPVRVRQHLDEYREAHAVADLLDQRSAEERDGSVAVFFRTNALSIALERVFFERGIPYVMIGGSEFFERTEVKDLLAWLRFLANPRDLISLLRIINTPSRGIGKKAIELLLADARHQGLPPGILLNEHSLSDRVPPRSRKPLREFQTLLRKLPEPRPGSISEFVRDVLEISGYREWWQSRDIDMGDRDRLQNIMQVVALATDFDKRTKASLSEFLAWIGLLTDLDRKHARDKAIPIMTIHVSKGLEFDQVHIVGTEENLIPHRMSLDTSQTLEEERRLLHVGMTRARKKLWLHCSAARNKFGRMDGAVPSRFLNELGDVGVEVQGIVPAAFGRTVEADNDHSDSFDDGDCEIRIGPGARIWHQDFGTGTIVRVRGRGHPLDRKVTIRFEDGSERILVPRHASFEVMEDS